ncbi:MAG: radical SAM protein [Deltaproteobacteria bacterium]|nr:radical SAM protein [Deltaproteobacteria bacterium]
MSLFSRARTSLRFLLRQGSGPFAPEEVIVEVTTRCNLACPMCVRTLGRRRPQKDVALDTFRAWVGNLPLSVERVAFAGLGEPLLHENIVDMVGLLSERGHAPVLYSNATLLTPELSRALLRAGLRAAILPIDGATRETYERWRKGADFEKTVANVRELIRLKRELAAPLFLELQMIRLPGTETELGKWRSTWSIPGVDSLRYKPDHMGEIEKRGAGSAAPSTPVSAGRGPAERHAGEGRTDEQPLATGPQRGICPMPWRGPATVDIDGNVYPCCVQSPLNVRIGRVPDLPLADIWNGAEGVRVRHEFLRHRRKLATCAGCDIPLLPAWASAAGNLLDPFLARRVLARIEPLLPFISGRRKA